MADTSMPGWPAVNTESPTCTIVQSQQGRYHPRYSHSRRSLSPHRSSQQNVTPPSGPTLTHPLTCQRHAHHTYLPSAPSGASLGEPQLGPLTRQKSTCLTCGKETTETSHASPAPCALHCQQSPAHTSAARRCRGRRAGARNGGRSAKSYATTAALRGVQKDTACVRWGLVTSEA